MEAKTRLLEKVNFNVSKVDVSAVVETRSFSSLSNILRKWLRLSVLILIADEKKDAKYSQYTFIHYNRI